MPIRDRIIWGNGNPLSDPRYAGLDEIVKGIRKGQRDPNVKGGRVFENLDNDLPTRSYDYYREYDVESKVQGKNRGTYRLVLGGGGEVFITGDHYKDFRQIINMPSDGADAWAARLSNERNPVLQKLNDFRVKLQNEIDAVRSEHNAQRNLLSNTDSVGAVAIGAIGYWTNRLYNTLPPDLAIWDNTLLRLKSAEKAIGMRDVKGATKQLVLARAYYLKALKQYVTWKDGLEGACTKMQVRIAVVAAGLIVTAVGAYAATVAVAEEASVAATEQAVARVAASVQRADVALRIVEATSLAEETAAARELDMAMEAFMKLSF
jgi:hypothetical protein